MSGHDPRIGTAKLVGDAAASRKAVLSWCIPGLLEAITGIFVYHAERYRCGKFNEQLCNNLISNIVQAFPRRDLIRGTTVLHWRVARIPLPQPQWRARLRRV